MRIPEVFNSIRWRILIWNGFLVTGLLGAFGFNAYELHRRNQIDQIDADLKERVTYLSSAVRRPPGRDREGGPGMRRPRPMEGTEGPEEFDRFRRDFRRGPGPGGPGFDGGPPNFPGEPPDFHEGRMPPFDREGPMDRRPIELSGESLRLFDESDTNSFYYVIWSRSGVSLKKSTNGPSVLELPAGRAGVDANRTRDGFREAYLFTERGDCVLAGISLGSHENRMRRVAARLGGSGLMVLALGLGGAWWLATRSIKPLDRITSTANRIAAGNLSERIPVGDTVNELARLARVLNSTFARLEAAFAQQKQFTADASHELRTPLAVIISESQAALNRPRSAEEYRESLSVCHDSAQQMRSLADCLLELARFDAGQESIVRAPVDLGALAEQCVARVRPLAREKNVTLDSECHSDFVLGDEVRLGQVVTNLLQNAIYYNRPGGVVTVRMASSDAAATLTVADTGVGISPDDFPHVFERFYRADKSRARNEGHVGLGLAISKSVIDLHHGSISATSTLHEGTTFKVILPKR